MTETKQLIQAALNARRNAYAPYSNFTVGAAVETEDGKIYSGSNVENASHGLTICAERNALATAIANGERKFTQLVVHSQGAVMPCGACRQVIWELCGDIPIVLVDDDGHMATSSSSRLLPTPFGPGDLST